MQINGVISEYYDYPIGENESVQYFQAYSHMKNSSGRLFYLNKASPKMMV